MLILHEFIFRILNAPSLSVHSGPYNLVVCVNSVGLLSRQNDKMIYNRQTF